MPASWEICMQVKKQQLEPDMEQWTGLFLTYEELGWNWSVPYFEVHLKDLNTAQLVL